MTLKKPSRQQVKRALDLYENKLEQYTNVVGTGIVNLAEADSETPDSENTVAVYVRKKVPKDELLPQEVIPQHLEIKVRGGVIKVLTKVIEQGEVSLESHIKETLLN